ncbi:winged helix-turn-helix transcriptional regulator [Rhizobium sp. LEGMi198b]|uniref:winged helix-turn-helix transcriptional regulator n=1 Tax=Rhizobium sp. CNPSo 3464 TaxID=3021406 RepID=UPI002550DC65|nr:helix-turn-helix domain-containing protein [Rhizobium sp. CNPSo 3464]MDK4740611.1 helix-turn-helix domain-containing protein [Rhizobium sp. CNPSo 3464]
MARCQIFHADCRARQLFDEIADKWSMMVLSLLEANPMRFNALKRQIEGVSQKALTQSLRRLERNGLITRKVIPVSPVAVEYDITPLGRSLQPPFHALYEWMLGHQDDVDKARLTFDEVGRNI